MASRLAGFVFCTLFLAAGVAGAVVPAQVLAVNESKALKHEVLVVRERGTGELPIDTQHDRVNEHAVRRLGEIAELAPGKTGKLTLNLGPGTYLLLCNEPGHYKDGMVATLVVAP